jgi:hypothetical protein
MDAVLSALRAVYLTVAARDPTVAGWTLPSPRRQWKIQPSTTATP